MEERGNQNEAEAEQTASIKATDKRINDHWDRIEWGIEGDAYEAFNKLINEYQNSWKREVHASGYECYRRFRAEFEAVLFDVNGHFSPIGYLALKELQRTLETSETKGMKETERFYEENALEYGRLLGEAESVGRVTVGKDVKGLRGIPEGFVFEARDTPFLRLRAVSFGKQAATLRARRVALQGVIRSFERGEEKGEGDDFHYLLEMKDDAASGAIWDRTIIGEHHPDDEGSPETERQKLYRATREYVIRAARILEESPELNQFSDLAERLHTHIGPSVQGDSAVRNLKRLTGYEQDSSKGWPDFRERVILLAGQLENGWT